jgi:hypothetical protein
MYEINPRKQCPYLMCTTLHQEYVDHTMIFCG